MLEKEKYLSIYQGELSKLYKTHDHRGRVDGGYGRACWGEGMLDALAQWKAQSILDVGCGYGRFCDAVSKFVPRVVGMDIASVASGNVIDNPRIEFIDGEAKQLPLPSGSVEWITSFDCLEHCLEEDIDTILAEFDRVATRGFALSISYEPFSFAGVSLHMTVKPENWWIKKLSRYGKVTKEGRVPLTGVPYLICRKPIQKRLICYCAGGLGNRLLPLAACGELARQTGRKLVVLWRDDDFRCQAGFHELFENPIEVVTDEALSKSESCKIYAVPKVVGYEAAINRKSVLQNLVEKHGCSPHSTIGLEDPEQDVIVYHNNLLPTVDKAKSEAFLRNFIPVAELRHRIQAIATEYSIDESVIGVHARGTDFNVSVERYAEKIHSIIKSNPNIKFLVCSDDDGHEKHLNELFPSHVIVRRKLDHVRRKDQQDSWAHNTLTSNAAVKEAIVDLYLLSRTRFAIYHASSSYAQMVTALKGNCGNDGPSETKAAPPRQMPDSLRSAYTMGGRIPVAHCYYDESRRSHNLLYTNNLLAPLLDLAKKEAPGNYGDTDLWLHEVLNRFSIQGQNVLVMGSQVPYYEAVCLTRGGQPTTVEFGKINSEVSALKTMSVEELVQCHEQFDAAISISTFEHTGLGRYGDSLDPDGDIKAMMLLRTKVKHNGLLFLSVPMGEDKVVWNAHRVYGRMRFPCLIAGWKLLESRGGHQNSGTYRDKPYYQPVHVLQNDMEKYVEQLMHLFQKHPNAVFIETGTGLGRAVKAALRAGFQTIISIEENPQLHAFNNHQFNKYNNVHILQGESLDVLPSILAKLNCPATFWLDAHRTGGGLDGGKTPYPLLEELRLIQSHSIRTHTLLIDDRRLFESEFGIQEREIQNLLRGINNQYRFTYADSTPATVAYGIQDILVAAPPSASAAKTLDQTGTDVLSNKTPDTVAVPMQVNATRILYYCPDVSVPSAGVRRLYRHVAILCNHGFDAAILHHRKGFTAPDQTEVPILSLEEITIGSQDVVVIPEGHPQVMYALRDQFCRRFAIALNWHYIYKNMPAHMDWRAFHIERVIVVSPFIGQMISWAMRLPIHLIDSSIGGHLYQFEPHKKKNRVVFIERKANDAEALMHLLSSRNPDYTKKIEWRPLANLPEVDYAAEIREASVFLNLSFAEGFPTSCLEAMSAGTLVTGFDGVGGRELLQHGENCFLSPIGDYVTLAYTLAPLLDGMLNGGLEGWRKVRENGLQMAAEMTADKEKYALIQFWQSVLKGAETGTAIDV